MHHFVLHDPNTITHDALKHGWIKANMRNKPTVWSIPHSRVQPTIEFVTVRHSVGGMLSTPPGPNRKRTFFIDLGMAPVSDVGFGGGGLAASDDGSCLTSFFTVAAASPAPVAEERPITSPRFILESNRCRIVMKLT